MEASNDLKIVVTKRDLELVHVYLVIKTGSIYETENEHGLCHFIEHCIFAGTKSFPNENAVWESIENIGGSINAYTSRDHTAIFCKVLPQYLEDGLKLLSDLALHPRFDIKDIEREKKILFAEILRSQTDPTQSYVDILLAELFPSHSVRHNILGTKENIKRFNTNFLRSFHSQFYTPCNMTLAITGPLDEIGETSAKLFLKNCVRNDIEFPDYQKLSETKTSTKKTKDEQPLVMIGFKTENSTHDDAPVIHFVSYILGQVATFGLRSLIRFQNGLAYSVSSAWNNSVSGSHAIFMAKCEKKSINKVEKICREFIDIISTHRINETTLNRLKNSYLGHYLSNQENPETQTKNIAYCTAYHASLLLHAEDRVKNLTSDDILRVVERYFANYDLIKFIP